MSIVMALQCSPPPHVEQYILYTTNMRSLHWTEFAEVAGWLHCRELQKLQVGFIGFRRRYHSTMYYWAWLFMKGFENKSFSIQTRQWHSTVRLKIHAWWKEIGDRPNRIWQDTRHTERWWMRLGHKASTRTWQYPEATDIFFDRREGRVIRQSPVVIFC